MKLENRISAKIVSLSESHDHVAIAVCSAADLGKSFLSVKITEILNQMGVRAGHLPLDSFLINRTERIKLGISGYQPNSYDFDSIEQSIINFKNGHDVAFYPYNHLAGEKENEAVVIRPCNVLIIDGLHSMHELLKPHIMFSLFVYTDNEKLRKIRREADFEKRRQPSEISQRLEPIEFKNYKHFVEPYKDQADLQLFLKEKWDYVVVNKENRQIKSKF